MDQPASTTEAGPESGSRNPPKPPTGKRAEALAAYEKARAIQERLARQNSTVSAFQNELARSHNNIGRLLRETGKSAESLAAYEKARAIQERLARVHPESSDFASNLGGTLNNLGTVGSDQVSGLLVVGRVST